MQRADSSTSRAARSRAQAAFRRHCRHRCCFSARWAALGLRTWDGEECGAAGCRESRGHSRDPPPFHRSQKFKFHGILWFNKNRLHTPKKGAPDSPFVPSPTQILRRALTAAWASLLSPLPLLLTGRTMALHTL